MQRSQSNYTQVSAVARPAQRGPGLLAGGCLTALIAGALAVTLFVIVAGVAIGRIGSIFDYNPFGLFAEPEIEIDGRQAAVIVQIQSLARLETMTYRVEKVIEAEKSGNMLQDVFFGDRILLIANGEVIAGVDLGKLREDDVVVSEDDAVTVTLPRSEIFVATLDNEQTRVYDRDQGLLSRGDSQLETRARQAAEAAILQAACDQQILERAAGEARVQIAALLGLLDFSDVTVVAEPGTCPAPDTDD
jgi:hypothetical protein